MIPFQIIGSRKEEQLNAIFDGQQVGYLYFSIRDKGHIWLADIKLRETTRAFHRSWIHQLLHPFYVQPKPMSIRGNGIGQALLSELITLAKQNRAYSISGNVTEDDVIQSPFLLNWYQKNGFTVSTPIEGELVKGKYSVSLEIL